MRNFRHYFQFYLRKLKKINKNFKNDHHLVFVTLIILGIISFKVLYLLPILIIYLKLNFNFTKFVLVLSFLLIGFSFAVYDNKLIEEELSTKLNNIVELYGTIDAEPRDNLYSDELTIKFDNLSSKVLVKISELPDYKYQDRVWVTGKLQSIENQKYPQSYITYLTSKRVFFIILDSKIETIESNNFLNKLSGFRENLAIKLEQNLSTKIQEYIKALMLGLNNDLSKDIKETSIRTGTSHAITISGFHMAMIYLAILSFAGIINRKLLNIFSILIITIFICIVGFYNLPAQRSGIFIILMIFCELFGRKKSTLFFINLTLLLLLLQNSFYWMNISLILSLSSTYALFFFSDKFLKRISFMRIHSFFKNYIATTLSIYLITVPITLFLFEGASIISILANLAISLFIPLIMLCAFVFMLTSLLNISFINFIVSIPLEIITKLNIEIISLLSQTSFAYTMNKIIPVVFIIVILLFMIALDFKSFTKLQVDEKSY